MTLAEVLGWAANVIAAVLDVFAFPATAMFWIASLLGRVERDPLSVFLNATLEIGVFWAVAAFTVGGFLRWIARLLEIWIVPAVIRSARVDAARKVVARSFSLVSFWSKSPGGFRAQATRWTSGPGNSTQEFVVGARRDGSSLDACSYAFPPYLFLSFVSCSRWCAPGSFY